MAARLGPLAQAGTVEQAIAFGDVVVMVVPYAALEEIGKTHGRALASKPLVLDICNPIARRDGEAIVQWVNEQGGAGLASAKLLPGARIVRAFNAISYRKQGAYDWRFEEAALGVELAKLRSRLPIPSRMPRIPPIAIAMVIAIAMAVSAPTFSYTNGNICTPIDRIVWIGSDITPAHQAQEPRAEYNQQHALHCVPYVF